MEEKVFQLKMQGLIAISPYFDIRHSLFDIRHSSFSLRHS
jgi:hypothetical protein